MKRGNLPGEGTVDHCCSFRECGWDRLIHQPYSGQDHLGKGKDCELLYVDGWEAWEAVFDPNHSAGPDAEYPNNEDLLKNKH